MINIAMDFFIICLLFLLIWRKDRIFSIKGFSDDYLSPESSKMLKGFFSLVVIFHHVAQRTSAGFLFHRCNGVGYLAVAVFFFLSGYGLQKKYMADSNYSKQFLWRRLPSILIPYVIITFIYWLYYAVSGTIYSIQDIMISIWTGEPIVFFSWYVINILIFYLVFNLLMLLCKKHYYWMLFGSCLFYVFWTLVCYKLGFGKWWYISSHLLSVGIFFAIEENKLRLFFQKCYRAITPITFILFFFFYRYPKEIAKFIPIKGMHLLVTLMTALLFTLSILFVVMKFPIGNRILSYLGGISLELYLTQGLMVLFARSNWIYIKNECIYFLVILVGTLILAFFFHKLCHFILEKYKAILPPK